jgi:nucleotide-binding universal stress UspA family protein
MGATVVVGFDGSPAARQALREAALLAHGGRVVAVHAHEPAGPKAPAHRWEPLAGDDPEQSRRTLEAAVRDAAADAGGVTFEGRLVSGHPATAVLDVAHEAGADMIVIGSHGWSAFSSILGSVSHELVRKADVPLTIIPPACADRMTAGEMAAGTT